MGREIVYCARCAVRLTGDDFEEGSALRLGHRVLCSTCAPSAPDGGPLPTGEEQDAPSSLLEILPEPCTSDRGHGRRWLLAAGMAAGFALAGWVGYRILAPNASTSVTAVPLSSASNRDESDDPVTRDRRAALRELDQDVGGASDEDA